MARNIGKCPKNVQAIRDWYADRPDDLDNFDRLLELSMAGDAVAGSLLALALHGFEAGRVFECENPDIPLGGGSHYTAAD